VLEALEQQSAAIRTLVLPLLRSLDDFDPGDFPPGSLERLETIRAHQEEHLAAVQALVAENGGTPNDDIPDGPAFSSVDELLSTLSENLDDVTAMYAATVPATQDGATRQTMMEIASVASRHAAVAGSIADRNPLPNAFQPPSILTGL
jgi:hypothetical protein